VLFRSMEREAFNQAIVTEAKEVSETDRGSGGFGSTGDKLTAG